MNALISMIILCILKIYYRSKRLLTHNRFFLFLKKSFHYSYLRYFGVDTEFGHVNLVGLPIIRKSKNSRIILGRDVTLVSSSYGNVAGINHPVILTTLGEGATIHLEEGCGLSGSSVCAVKGIRIGKNSGLGANASVYDTDFHVVDSSREDQEGILDAEAKPVEIGENVWVAANVLILKGVTIGNDAVIGAGSVVSKNIQANMLVIGNPAKEVRKI